MVTAARATDLAIAKAQEAGIGAVAVREGRHFGAASLYALRIANADILPYDYVEYAKTMRRYVAPIDRLVADHRWTAPTTALKASIDHLEREGMAFAAARDSSLTGSVPTQTLERTNRAGSSTRQTT